MAHYLETGNVIVMTLLADVLRCCLGRPMNTVSGHTVIFYGLRLARYSVYSIPVGNWREKKYYGLNFLTYFIH